MSERVGLDGRQIQQGGKGEVWMDADYLSGAKSINTEYEFEKEDVNTIGDEGFTDTQIVAKKGKGSLNLYKLSSLIYRKYKDFLENGGEEPRLTLMSIQETADGRREQFIYTDVSLDKVVMQNAEAKKLNEIEIPFTFKKVKSIELI